MIDLHDRFTSWVLGGAFDDLSRDVALHASACPECRRLMAALDALVAIDIARAPLPPQRSMASWRRSRALARAGRVAAGVAGALLVGSVAAFGTARLLGPVGLGSPASPSSSANEGVLGGTGRPTASPSPRTPRPTPTPSPTPDPTPSPSPTPQVVVAPPRPVVPLPPPPPPPPVVTPVPTPAETPTPLVTPTPIPTETPSPPVTPTPSLVPTP